MPLLTDIVIIFALSTGVNLLFTRLKIPTIVGYLLTGILAGPHLLSLIGSEHEIELLAEIGVALLLFTIGMEFSLRHLLKIRKIVFFGGFLQVFITAIVFYGASRFYGLGWKAGIFLGFLAALSSSALVLKLLQERSELSSNYGRTVLGVLIFQDLMLVPLLLFTDVLSNQSMDIGREIIVLSIKAAFIIFLVYAGNKWILPRILHQIAMAKNQELFMMTIFLICFSVALLTSALGMSIAFGAFLAGLMISESKYSHNAFANLMPFKDTFTSFFFVSIGMLLDVSFLLEHPGLVVVTVMMVILLKTFIAGGTGFILGHTFRGTVLVGLALSQVGEFSFILAKIGHDMSIISDHFYQLFLAVTVITMSLTPLLMKFSVPTANILLKLPLPPFLVNGLYPLPEVEIPDMRNHLLIIGKDDSAMKLSRIADHFKMPHISVIFDPSLAKDKMDHGDLVIYGDAVNKPILLKAHADSADIVLISVGNIIASMTIIEKVRELNPKAKIIVRTRTIKSIAQLYQSGANQVLPEKLEIAIDLFHRALIERNYSESEINKMLTHFRSSYLGEFEEKDLANKPSLFDRLLTTTISSIEIEDKSPAAGRSIKEIRLRTETGVTILALKRKGEIIEHPEPTAILHSNDILYVLGNPEQLEAAHAFFSHPHEDPE